jgi:Dioxygenases related to 2-nitropropane dioxygenase
MKNNLCTLLGIRYPILQGAMTNVSNDVGLVSAVSNAGGLGIFAPGIENVDMDYVRTQIRAIRAATDKPFGVNIMLASAYAPQIVDVVCEEKVPVVTTGAGNPTKYMEKLKAAGVIVGAVVASTEVAAKLGDSVDFIVAEGMESGGYIGRMSTLTLIPAVADAVRVPVVAAGGFADGRGLAAAIMLGAQGVQMGTRFLTTAECTIPDWCKEALVAAQAKDAIVLGDRIGVSAHLRVLKTAATAAILSGEGAEGATAEAFQEAVIEARTNVYEKGLDGTLLGVGQCIGAAKGISTVAETIDGIVTEYNNIVKEAL